ncbi:MAG: hypothetical protein AAGJ79_10865 [Verrucomicrobiota bacterium]
MSDNWIAIVPEDPGFVPRAETQQTALEMFQEIAPDADEIEIKLSDKVQFFDCGANLEKITCPKCGEEVSGDWWQDRMDDDFESNGFRLSEYAAPCCSASVRLDELRYDWPQAFARFGIDAMNPNIGELSDGQRRGFEQILGTPLRTIYQHI